MLNRIKHFRRFRVESFRQQRRAMETTTSSSNQAGEESVGIEPVPSCIGMIAFRHCGLPYEYKPVNLPAGEQFSPEFKCLNPLHFVPVLVDGDTVVSDSFAILLYLGDKYPQRLLLPADPWLKALNLQAASIISSSMQPLHMLSVLKYLTEKFGPEESLSWAQSNIEKGFFALEALLKDYDSRYATGDDVYMADVFLAPQIVVATTRFNINMSKFPTLSRLHESYKILPEFEASLPERQPDAMH